MKARAFFQSSKIMLPGAVIGATFSPGFSTDLSRWRLIIDIDIIDIDEEGNLFQDTNVWQWTEENGIIKEQRQEHIHIGEEAVIQWKAIHRYAPFPNP